jgi:3-hydroxybutyryl-CoA dehydrogenase
MTSVVVLGTGRMAAGLAAAAAAAPGVEVSICGRDPGRTRQAVERARALGPASTRAVELSRGGLARADVVLETVVESLAVKRDVLARVGGWVRPDALVASNTSSLPLTELASAVSSPERFVGLHFLYPAHATGVVEVAPAAQTAPATLRRAEELVRAMGRQPIVLRRDVQGLIWNRLQFAVLRECLHLLDEDVADAEQIDAAMSDGLAPRWMACGPLATADLGGLGTFLLASEQLFPRLSAAATVSTRLAEHAGAGTTFHAWSPAKTRAVEELRERALAAGQQIARRRRDAMEAASRSSRA